MEGESRTAGPHDDAALDRQVLRELADREAIRAVLAVWCRGLDRNDVELMSSAYHDDAVDERGSHRYDGVNPAEDYVNRHKMWKRHLHFTTNEHIVLDGDSARCESYFMAQLVIDGDDGGEELHQYGGRHLDHFDRRAGQWRIANRLAILEWRTKSTLIPVPDKPYPEFPQLSSLATGSPQYGSMGARSTDDPSYHLPWHGSS